MLTIRQEESVRKFLLTLHFKVYDEWGNLKKNSSLVDFSQDEISDIFYLGNKDNSIEFLSSKGFICHLSPKGEIQIVTIKPFPECLLC